GSLILFARGKRLSGDSPRLISLEILLATDGLWFFPAKYRYDEGGGIKTCLNTFKHYIIDVRIADYGTRKL
nr:hypothetical protein [Dehalococcoidia bacterium]